MIPVLFGDPLIDRSIVTVGGIFALGLVIVLALGLARGRRPSEAGAPKKVPLRDRYLTLVALALAVLVPAGLGERPFAAVVGLLVWLGLQEFWRMLEAGGTKPHGLAGSLVGLGLVAAALVGGASALGAAFALGLLVLLAVALFGGELESLPARTGGTLLGVGYVALTAAFMVAMRAGPQGFGRVLFFLMVIQLADAFGLVGGLAFGKHPLAPRISPGKTLEGTLGSALAAMGGAWLFAYAVPTLPLWWAITGALVLFGVGLVGDLLASGFKRAVGLKDFGTLLPGHGGLLDRFDGYLFAAPVAWSLYQLADWARQAGYG